MVSGIDMLVGAIEKVDEEHEFIAPDKGLFKRMSIGKENHIIMEDSIKGLKSKQLRQLEDLLYEIEDAGFTVGIPQEEIDKLLESLRIDEKELLYSNDSIVDMIVKDIIQFAAENDIYINDF